MAKKENQNQQQEKEQKTKQHHHQQKTSMQNAWLFIFSMWSWLAWNFIHQAGPELAEIHLPLPWLAFVSETETHSV